MKLKNYQEDVVLHVAEIVIDDRPDVEKSEKLLHDVAAFTLNRLPPRYIMSERGITRFAADHWLDDESRNGFRNLVGILMLVNEAIDVITKRRKSPANGNGKHRAHREESTSIEYWHNIPCIVGRVADSQTGIFLPEVNISFSIDGSEAEPADEGWPNPYVTSEITNGFFSFLPRPVKNRALKASHVLSITFKHPKYRELVIERKIECDGGFERDENVINGEIVNLETAALVRL